MCSGNCVRGKTTTCSGNRGSSRDDMVLLLRFMQIEGKVILITGASEGIGAACAAEFRKRGARLSLTARSAEKLHAVGAGDALVTPGDITVAETRRLVVDRTLERFGAIDVLVNNAGMGMYAPSWRAS